MNIILAETFFNDVLLNSEYANADYRNAEKPTFIKTLGFYSAGDGGAGIYKVADMPDITDWVSDMDYEEAIPDGVSFYFGQGYFWQKNSVYSFELIPQKDQVIAEQIGILPDDVEFARYNRRLISVGNYYATQNGYSFEFSSGKTYYITPYSIAIRSNTLIEGNNAQIVVVNYLTGNKSIFCCSNKQKNIIIRNLNIKGRKKIEEVTDEETQETTIQEIDANEDTAIHCCAENLVLSNVNIEWFCYAFRSFTQTYEASEDEEYVIPEIVNKNWLIDTCIANNTGMGLQISEIDGIILKNSRIYSQLSGGDGEHNLYISSNCSNIRINNTTLGNVNGGAIHKHYSPGDKAVKFTDRSHNHFYTDIVMHDAETCMLLGVLCENINSDSIFATQINRLLVLSSSWNCIISNCNLSQTRQKEGDDAGAFIVVWNAAQFWMQNSDVYYTESHRTAAETDSKYYYQKMCEKYPNSKRPFIGENKDIDSLLFKFTGCNIESVNLGTFYLLHSSLGSKSTISEYWDNCIWKLKFTSENLFKIECINSLFSGFTMRNCYFKNLSVPAKAPFRYWCSYKNDSENGICPIYLDCFYANSGKCFPWLRFENTAFNNFSNVSSNNWEYLLQVSNNFTTPAGAAKLSNSYVSNCYKFTEDLSFKKMNNLMAK